MPTQTLMVTGSYGFDASIRFDEIVRDFGDGYDNTVLVGNSAGLLLYTLRYDFLDYRTDSLSVTDPEDSTLKSWPVYLWDFYKRRKVDGAAFNLKYGTDQFNVLFDSTSGTAVLVKFVDSTLSYQGLTFKLFSTGIQLRQYRPAS